MGTRDCAECQRLGVVHCPYHGEFSPEGRRWPLWLSLAVYVVALLVLAAVAVRIAGRQ